jgi:hypothetical protein
VLGADGRWAWSNALAGKADTASLPKAYFATISQTGTSAPTAAGTPVNGIGTVAFAYIGNGAYSLTSSGLFIADKTRAWVRPHLPASNTIEFEAIWQDASTILINAMNGNSTIVDIPFEVVVYP